MDVEAIIREALRTRTPLALVYAGDGGAARTVQPQVLYLDSEGTALLDCRQLEGPSKSGGPLPGWRAFELTAIERAELLDGAYERAPDLNLQASKYVAVLASL